MKLINLNCQNEHENIMTNVINRDVVSFHYCVTSTSGQILNNGFLTNSIAFIWSLSITSFTLLFKLNVAHFYG